MSLIMRNAGLSEENEELFFKAPLAVMLFLVKDICSHGSYKRWAYAQSRVPLLPFENKPVFSHPPRRIRFQLLDRFCHRHVGLEPEKNMRVVRGTTNRDRYDPKVLRSSLNVGP